MIIKIKSIIYQWTGIYLAHKEENEYLKSKDFWDSFNRFKLNDESMSYRNVQGIVLGCWQVMNGFYREFNSKKYKEKMYKRLKK